MKHIRLLFLKLLTALLSTGAYAQANRLYIPDIMMSRGSESILSVNMDNIDEVTAVEFTLEVPDGFSVNPTSAILAERAKEHQITARKLKNGKYVCRVYGRYDNPKSSSSAPFLNGSVDSLISFTGISSEEDSAFISGLARRYSP